MARFLFIINAISSVYEFINILRGINMFKKIKSIFGSKVAQAEVLYDKVKNKVSAGDLAKIKTVIDIIKAIK
jgi:hypothetical protein